MICAQTASSIARKVLNTRGGQARELAEAQSRYGHLVKVAVRSGNMAGCVRALMVNNLEFFAIIVQDAIRQHEQVLSNPDSWRESWLLVIDGDIVVTISGSWIQYRYFRNTAWTALPWYRRVFPSSNDLGPTLPHPTLIREHPRLF